MTLLETLIGQIVSSFVRTDFMLSHVAHKIGKTQNYLEFFADPSTGGKTSSLLKYIKIHSSQIDSADYLVSIIEEFDILRIHRNQVVHSLILVNTSDENEFMAYKYYLKNGVIERNNQGYTRDELEQLKIKISEVHNKLYEYNYSKLT